MQIDSLNHFKLVSTNRFFVRPADENYVLARWMIINGFHREFFWQALQATEKYLKAGLVLQGGSVKGATHDLEKLYGLHLRSYGNLAFASFAKPPELAPHIWRDEEPSAFLKRLNMMGNPDARYGMRSWWREPDDLFKFDQLCGGLRRLVVGLDWIVGDGLKMSDGQVSHQGHTFESALNADPAFQPLGEIENLDRSLTPIGDTRREVLHAWNFTYRRTAADFEKPAPRFVAPNFGPMENTYLFLYWQHLTATDVNGKRRRHAAVFIQGMRWLIENFKIESETKQLFLSELSKAERRQLPATR